MEDEPTEASVNQRPPVEDSTDAKTAAPPPSEFARQAEVHENWLKAADLWRESGNLLAERAALLKTKNRQRTALVEAAIGLNDEAFERSKHLLESNPADHSLRLRLISNYLQRGNRSEAKDLAGVLIEPGGPIKPDAKTLGRLGMLFESFGEYDFATSIYKIALANDAINANLSMRVTYLQHFERLARKNEEGGIAPPTPLLGHSALGGLKCQTKLPQAFPKDPFPSAFAFVRLLKETEQSVMFEGIDRHLDFPVAVKLQEFPLPSGEIENVRQRMRALFGLNHPNISKLTYADSIGGLIRVVYEFHGGGSLPETLARLDNLGFPMAMRFLIQIASALDWAHRKDLAHGNLKADNVMFGPDQLVKLGDFQIWKDHPAPLYEEFQQDLIAFGSIIRLVISKITVAPPTPSSGEHLNPMEEAEDLAGKIERHEIEDLQTIRTILGNLLDRSLPSKFGTRKSWESTH